MMEGDMAFGEVEDGHATKRTSRNRIPSSSSLNADLELSKKE